ncbi:DNA-directed RNA polymerase subunit L [Halobaculum sp. P14]|uniref:DNA-directed RNA polymerase subunit L n=1 Tax=Halobaculum sp. P14 TaxID=3421638 RepID=UPI003EC0449F
MELRVLEKSDEELRIEVAGEDHTFMNVLKGELLQTDGVTAATYDMNPEQSGGQTEPILSIKTESGVDPLNALGAAAEGVSENMSTLYDDIDAAFAEAA